MFPRHAMTKANTVKPNNQSNLNELHEYASLALKVACTPLALPLAEEVVAILEDMTDDVCLVSADTYVTSVEIVLTFKLADVVTDFEIWVACGSKKEAKLSVGDASANIPPLGEEADTFLINEEGVSFLALVVALEWLPLDCVVVSPAVEVNREAESVTKATFLNRVVASAPVQVMVSVVLGAPECATPVTVQPIDVVPFRAQLSVNCLLYVCVSESSWVLGIVYFDLLLQAVGWCDVSPCCGLGSLDQGIGLIECAVLWVCSFRAGY